MAELFEKVYYFRSSC